MNDIKYDAELSECGEYRYRLSRIWDERKKPLTFIMLNPSTADAEVDDPTIRRCMGFAEREQAGGIIVVNLYGFRATRPFDLFQATDPIGPGNDRALKRAARQAKSIVCAWGAHAPPNRVAYVRALLDQHRLSCLGTTKHGAPKHPLYLRRDQPLEHYQP